MFLIRTILSFFKDEIYRELMLTIIVVILVGMTVFHFTEGWSWFDSLYFSVSTITTTGYGDLYPVTKIGKTFNIFYLLMSLVLMLLFINTMNQHYNARKEKKSEAENRRKKIVKTVHEKVHEGENDH